MVVEVEVVVLASVLAVDVVATTRMDAVVFGLVVAVAVVVVAPDSNASRR